MVEYRYFIVGLTRTYRAACAVEVGGYSLGEAYQSMRNWERHLDGCAVILAASACGAVRRYQVGDVE